jgi:CPA2 family monovalent cation:H+ antiporter-2
MPSILQTTLILLASALAGVLIIRASKLPPILGYLLAGLVIGPNATALAGDSNMLKNFAEFGVVFLMFSIGLEFNLSKLKSMRNIVFGFGASQVFLTMLLTIPAGYFLRFVLPISLPWHVLLALGGALAMSSTAIVVKGLAEKFELDTPHGKNVIGVLIFQDLVVIFLLILIPSLNKNSGDMALALSIAAVKIGIALILILVVGKTVFSSWFKLVANMRSRELFMLNVLLVVMGFSAVTEYFGLSMALGAFMAGILIAETPYRFQVEEGIESFRDILLGLFFISIGMLVDFHVVFNNFYLVVFLFLGALVLKFIIIAGLAKRFGASAGEAIRTGICLTQAGEFGFVLIQQIDQLDWIDQRVSQAVIAAMLLSMMLAPILIQYSDKITLRFVKNEWFNQSLNLTKIATQSLKNSDHVIICGFGISGQQLATILEQEQIKYIALDEDPDRVSDASQAGKSVVYGTSQSKNHLIAAGIVRAKAVVITFQNINESMKVIQQVELLHPGIPIIVRATDERDVEKLELVGATQVIPEKTEGGLMLSAQVLTVVGVPIKRVLRRVTQARENRYGDLKGFFPSFENDDGETSSAPRLHSVKLKENTQAIGKDVEWLHHESGANLHSIRRKITGSHSNYKNITLDEKIVFQAEDILTLLGEPDCLDKAENRLNKIKV